MTSVFSWQNSVSLCPASFCTQGQTFLDSRYLLISYFCISVPYGENDIFFGISSRRSCRSSQNCSTLPSLALVVRAQTCIIVILNGLPWKRTEIFCHFRNCTQCCILDSFVDFEGYSIFSKGFIKCCFADQTLITPFKKNIMGLLFSLCKIPVLITILTKVKDF